ncbi:hypothetical protein [Paenibacillus apis]|nr:hypothetical protein [Paenibacillus apis]
MNPVAKAEIRAVLNGLLEKDYYAVRAKCYTWEDLYAAPSMTRGVYK